jgi:hypothetical protein
MKLENEEGRMVPTQMKEDPELNMIPLLHIFAQNIQKGDIPI